MTGAARRALTPLAALCLVVGCPAWIDRPHHADDRAIHPAALSVAGYDPGKAERVDAATVFNDSTSIPCAPGTTDLGVHDGYHQSVKIPVRLCAVDNLPNSSTESNPSSSYYIRNGKVGAKGHAIVNSRVSGPMQAMVRDMKAAGVSVRAFSTYRSMERQQALCAKDSGCPRGDYRLQARPGTSNHQMGVAIDFTMPQTKDAGASCAAPASNPNNAVWKWLSAHAGNYGFKQYAAESWHWEPLTAANRC
jgi:hypothetical protein